MKKQLMSIALLTLILSSCQKEKVPEFSDNLKTNSIAPPPKDPITLQTVTLHTRLADVSFGWENNGGFQVHNIKSSLGNGGGIGWQQSNSFWNTDPSNPAVIVIIITGIFEYYSLIKGATKIKEAVIIQVSYNTLTGVSTTNTYSTNSTWVK